MAIIRPCADLRNNYSEISRICHETNNPVYITKNGYSDLVILSPQAYEKYEEERINKLISEQISKRFSNFDDFRKDLYKKIKTGLEDIKKGNSFLAEEVFKEMEDKYNLNK